MNFKLTRNERLKSRKQIEFLFLKGKTLHEPPIFIRWVVTTIAQDYPVKIMFSVSKKKFKRAVDRNRIKRLLREAYRKNKWLLYDDLTKNEKQIHLSIVFTGKAEISYAETEAKIILTLQRLIQELNKTTL